MQKSGLSVVVFLPVPQTGVPVRVCWCGAFPHRGFAIQFIVGVLVGFELFLVGFALFPTGFFAEWLYQLRAWFALFPTGVFAVSLCQFPSSFVLLVGAFPHKGFRYFARDVSRSLSSQGFLLFCLCLVLHLSVVHCR